MQAFNVAFLIIIGVLLFSFIIFFHELGHFLFAKLGGIRVNEFSLGMGPRLFGFRRGETEYSLRALPIGGFCAMEGEDEASDREDAFGSKPVWKRVLVIVAGGLFNILLGLVMMLFLLAPQEVYATTTISQFAQDSALAQAGAQVGDRIVEIDGYAVYTDRDLSFAMALADPAALHLVAEDAKGQRITLAAFLDCGHLCRCGGDAGERQQFVRCFLVQHQVLGFKDLHPALIAEGRQPAGDSSTAQKNEMCFEALQDQRAKGLLRVRAF